MRTSSWLVALLVVVPGALSAQSGFSIGADAGAMFYDGSIRLRTNLTVEQRGLEGADPALAYGGRGVFHANDMFGLEVAYLRSDLENSAFELVTHVYYANVEARLPLHTNAGVRVALGGGGIRFDPKGNEEALSDPLLSGALGLGVSVGESAAFWLDMRGFAQRCRNPDADASLVCVADETLAHAGLFAGLTYTF